jgi:hypothetical protein
MATSFASFGQNTIATPWTGAWKLNLKQSTFGTVLIPGVPNDFKILSQTLTIEPAANGIRLVGDSTVSAGGESQTGRDDNTLRFDGTPTRAGNVSLCFHQINHSGFEIDTTIDAPNGNVSEVSRYDFSSDGKRLTATKMQTARAPVPAGTDKNKGVVLRASKSVLVYQKVSEHK